MINRHLQEKLHKSFYNDLRSIVSVHDKITISTIVLTLLFDKQKFANLVYSEQSLQYWIDETNQFYQEKLNTKDIFLEIKIDNNVIDCFEKVKKSLARIFDQDGYLKALYEKDEFALAIYDITKILEKFNNNQTLDNIQLMIQNFKSESNKTHEINTIVLNEKEDLEIDITD